MAVQAADLQQYEGKKVVLVRNLSEPNEKGERAVELEGTAVKANALGVMFKPKGRTNVELIELGEIESVSLAPDGDKKIAAKMLKPVELGSAKSHLLERHGFTLGKVNGMTEEDAFKAHESIDHKASDLGHYHGVKAEKADAAAAVAAAEATS